MDADIRCQHGNRMSCFPSGVRWWIEKWWSSLVQWIILPLGLWHCVLPDRKAVIPSPKVLFWMGGGRESRQPANRRSFRKWQWKLYIYCRCVCVCECACLIFTSWSLNVRFFSEQCDVIWCILQKTSEHGSNASHKVLTMQRILVSVLHAQRCRGSCQDPCCLPMKRVLAHLAGCTDRKSCSGMNMICLLCWKLHGAMDIWFISQMHSSMFLPVNSISIGSCLFILLPNNNCLDVNHGPHA